MRTGYAILDRYQYGWLQTRTRMENVDCPVTVWTLDEEDALVFRRLKDARAMLKVVRRHHRDPERVRIVDPRLRVVV